MGNAPSPPPPPDPVKTAQAQTESNVKTATTSQQLNMVNQTTPYGSLTYTQDGTWADGTPHYSATTTLSPEQQKLYGLYTDTQANLGHIGVEQSQKVRDILNTPFDFNTAIAAQQRDMGNRLLDPVWQQREAALETSLANKGIQQGSEAYTAAMRDFGMQRDNAYIAGALQSRGQAATEALTQRNQPLNEISALQSASQVQLSSFTGTPQTQVANTDVAGLTMDAYKYGPLAQYQQQSADRNAMLGGLFGLGSAALGGWARGAFGK